MTRRALGVLAHLAAVAALLVLGLRPTRRVAAHPDDVILATRGVGKESLRRLADSVAAPIVRIPEDEPDAGALLRRRRDVGSVIVAGWGLDESDLAELGRTPLLPGPSSPLPGVTHLSWPATLTLGEPFTVLGTAARPGGRVRLTGPGGPADSGATDRDGRFRVTDTPRAAGPHLYVVAADGAAPETLGVHVTPPAPPRVLVVAAAPSFETRALRDWLAGAGGAVAVRAAVSRDRWHTEFVNRRATALVPLSARVLAQFDVVVTDDRTLAELPAGERAVIERAVREAGLGLVVTGTLMAGFVATPMPDLGERSVRPVLAGMPAPRVAVPAAAAALEDRFAVETVVRDGAGVGIVQAAPRGAGTIALSLVDGTSRWLRAGEPEVYAAFWTRVLHRTARAPVTWRAADGPRTVHRPVPLSGPAGEPAVIVTGPTGARDTVYVVPDPLDPARVHGTYWPRDAGWHDVAGAAFHVRGPEAWAGVAAAARLAATARAVARAPLPGQRSRAPDHKRRPLPLGWAFVLFVLATGYLWASRR